MNKLIEFIKSAASLGKGRDAITKTFTDAANQLKELNAKLDTTALKHDVKIALAQAKIDFSKVEQEALALGKKLNEITIAKLEALLA
jgi:nitrate reductase alpha subunit